MLYGQVADPNCCGKPRTVWIDVVLCDGQQLKMSYHVVMLREACVEGGYLRRTHSSLIMMAKHVCVLLVLAVLQAAPAVLQDMAVNIAEAVGMCYLAEARSGLQGMSSKPFDHASLSLQCLCVLLACDGSVIVFILLQELHCTQLHSGSILLSLLGIGILSLSLT